MLLVNINILQASKFFSQLNMYSPESNRWTLFVTDNCPDGIAGHGATIVGDSMVVFGGYHGHGNRSAVNPLKGGGVNWLHFAIQV